MSNDRSFQGPLVASNLYLFAQNAGVWEKGQVNELNQDASGYFVMASDMVAHVDHLWMQCYYMADAIGQGAKMNIYLVEGWKQTMSLTLRGHLQLLTLFIRT